MYDHVNMSPSSFIAPYCAPLDDRFAGMADVDTYETRYASRCERKVILL